MNLERRNLKSVELDIAQIRIGEYEDQLPFVIKRFYLITNFKLQESIHGDHALKNADQAFVLIKGKAEFTCFNRDGEKVVATLEELNEVLIIPKMMWRKVILQPDSILLSFASEVYDKDDYISDFDIYSANQIH